MHTNHDHDRGATASFLTPAAAETKEIMPAPAGLELRCVDCSQSIGVTETCVVAMHGGTILLAHITCPVLP